MAAKQALLGCVLFILWLVVRDVKRRQQVSAAVWIPLLWLVIAASRPVSLWFGGDPSQVVANIEDGSPLDRLVFLLLLAGGVVVLVRRHPDWRTIISSNRPLFAFFLYLALSASWSEYHFVSFKRWIKDLGNVVMVLVILTEKDPVDAVKAVFLRCAYILVPLSVLFIKYFPDIGRYYNRWTWTYAYGGVTTNKNELGATLIIYGLFLVWHFLDLRKDKAWRREKLELLLCLLLIGLNGWLLRKADSSTSLACLLLGLMIVLGTRLEFLKSRMQRFGAGGFAAVCAVIALLVVSGLGSSLVGLLGRDTTFTGRTDIWERLLRIETNPVIGVGYYSFWLNEDRVEKASEGLYFHLNESHNGYLEMYLNVGYLGMGLLALMALAAGKKVFRDIGESDDFGTVRLAFLVVALVYNLTEAAFCGVSPIWFALLLMVTWVPRVTRVEAHEWYHEMAPSGSSSTSPA